MCKRFYNIYNDYPNRIFQSINLVSNVQLNDWTQVGKFFAVNYSSRNKSRPPRNFGFFAQVFRCKTRSCVLSDSPERWHSLLPPSLQEYCVRTKMTSRAPICRRTQYCAYPHKYRVYYDYIAYRRHRASQAPTVLCTVLRNLPPLEGLFCDEQNQISKNQGNRSRVLGRTGLPCASRIFLFG